MAIKKKSKLRKLFIDDGRPDGTVILNNWNDNNWHDALENELTYIAEAFRVLAQKEVSRLKKNKGLGLHEFPIEDFRAYPIVFLYRHALELYLKAIILVGSDILTLKDQPKIERHELFKNHDLDQLREYVECVFEAYEWGWDLGNSNFRSVSDLRTIIGEFQEIDPRSSSFRYPVNQQGTKPLLEKGFRFNVFEFASTLDDLFQTLEGAVIGAHEEYQNQVRALAEAQDYAIQNSDYQYEYDYYEPDDSEPPDGSEGD